MKTFQQPLTAGEEAYYIRLLREGTVEESRQAREILVERNLRLVAHIAKKYQNWICRLSQMPHRFFL